MNSDDNSRLKKLKGWIATMALAIGVATFFGSFPDINSFRSVAVNFCCELFGQKEDCLSESTQWILFAILIIVCTVALKVAHGWIEKGVQSTRVSPRKRARARAEYLSYLEGEIAHRLRTSLPDAQMISIRCSELPEVVKGRRSSYNNHRADQPLSPMEAFDLYGGRLLILGEAGAGKSTVLYEIAQRLIDNAKKDESAPLPLLLSLSSFHLTSSQNTRAYAFRLPWARPRNEPSTEDFDNWLIKSLVDLSIRHLKRPIAKFWVDEDECDLALLLDGFDEVREDFHPIAAAAINASEFFSHHSSMPAVICCRNAQYDRLHKRHGTRFSLNGAIALQPLAQADVTEYLRVLDQPIILRALEQHPRLQSFAETPLNLNLLVNAYTELASDQSLDATSDLEFRSRLIDALVSKLNEREIRRIEYTQSNDGAKKADTYTDEEVNQVLEWVASKLTSNNLPELPLDRLLSFAAVGKGKTGLLESASLLGLVQFCCVLYGLLSFFAWTFLTSGSFTLKETVYVALLSFSLGFLFLIMGRYKLVKAMMMCFSIGILHQTFGSLTGFSTSQRLFTLATLICFVMVTTDQSSKKRSQVSGIGLFFTCLLIFFVISIAGVSGNVAYLLCIAIPFAWLAGHARKFSIDALPAVAVMASVLVTAAFFGFLVWLVFDTKVDSSNYKNIFAISSFAGLVWYFYERSALGVLTHFAMILGCLIVAGQQGGLIGASLWPLLSLYVGKDRSAGLNYILESKLTSPFILKMLSIGGQLPTRYSGVLAHAVRSGILKTTGKSFEFQHLVIRDHFGVRRYLRELPASTSKKKLEFIAELRNLSELGSPLLHKLSRDENNSVARAARDAYIDFELSKSTIKDADHLRIRPDVVATNFVRPRIIGRPANLDTPVYGREREIKDALTLLSKSKTALIVTVVAPPGYGKTALLRGLLQKVVGGDRIKQEYPAAIICLDARGGLSVDTVILAVASVTGSESLTRLCGKRAPSGEKLEALQTCLSKSTSLWLVLENAGHLLDKKALFRDQDLEKLVEGWNEGQKRSHLIIESHTAPSLRSARALGEFDLGKRLLDGLPLESAVAWVREIGKPCALDLEAEADLVKMVELFHRIPQRIELAVGFLIATRPSSGLQGLLQDQTLLQLLQAEDAKMREKGFLRIADQLLENLSPESRTLLGFVAYFPFAVPHGAAEIVLPEEELAEALDQLVRSRILHMCTDRAGNRRYLLSECLSGIIAEQSLWQLDADTVKRLSRRASELGRGESSEYAAEMWRCSEQLSYHEGTQFLKARAVAISKRGVFFDDLFRTAEAISAHKQAIGMLETLSRDDPGIDEEIGKAQTRLSRAYYGLGFIEEARSAAGRAVELLEALVDSGRVEAEPDLGQALSDQANCLWKDGHKNEAFPLTLRAHYLLQRAVETGLIDWEAPLANIVCNIGIFVWKPNRKQGFQYFAESRSRYEALVARGLCKEASLAGALGIEVWALIEFGRVEEALSLAERRVAILQKLVDQDQFHFELNLADAITDYAKLLYFLERYNEANLLFESALSRYHTLADSGAINAALLINKAPYKVYTQSLFKSERHVEAMETPDRLIDFFQSSIERAYTFLPELAASIRNKGDILFDLERLKEAAKSYSRAITRYEQAIDLGGDYRKELALTLRKLGAAHHRLKQAKKGIPFLKRSVEMFEELTQSNDNKMAFELAQSYVSLGIASGGLRLSVKSWEAMDKALSIYETLVNEGRGYESELAFLLYLRAFRYLAQAQLRKAASEQKQAFDILEQQIANGRTDLTDKYTQMKRNFVARILMRVPKGNPGPSVLR